MESRNARLGLVLFIFYTILYAGFVLLNAFLPDSMESLPYAGINLAIWYGFGLIVAALLLSLIYAWLCKAPAGDRSERKNQP